MSGARSAVWLGLGALAIGALASSTGRDHVKRSAATGPTGSILWPVDPAYIIGLGDTAGDRRPNGITEGLDIRAAAFTPVRAPEALQIVYVGDDTAKHAADPKYGGAGIWVEGEGQGRLHRFLHLAAGSVRVRLGQRIEPADQVGEIAPTGTSGNWHSPPHLHYEIREPRALPGKHYGQYLDPLAVLPPTGRRLIDRRLASLRAAGPGVSV